MHRILVAFDGSSSSQSALRFALGLAAHELKAELVLATVGEEPMPYAELSAYTPREDTIAAALESCHRAQLSADPILEGSTVRVQRHLRLGETAPTLVAMAEDLRCDWIIMGTRGMGTLGNLLLGSVANKVVHLTTLPVTLVR